MQPDSCKRESRVERQLRARQYAPARRPARAQLRLFRKAMSEIAFAIS
jgi:hypothetical protein